MYSQHVDKSFSGDSLFKPKWKSKPCQKEKEENKEMGKLKCKEEIPYRNVF